ncbi:MAG: CRISPR-associated protein Cas4 [Bacteroidetes bacterium]|nr:CRISPR-associated protein Cas4 [Bacteroidota bacterium]
MLEVITKWNLSRPDESITDFIDGITHRGYSGEFSFLTGEFSNILKEKKVKSLSVGNIADRICPTRRDLYFKKGSNAVKAKDTTNWGRRTGTFAEGFFYKLNDYAVDFNKKKYEGVNTDGKKFSEEYFNAEKSAIEELLKLELTSYRSKEGDTKWLLKILNSAGRAELAARLIHSILNQSRYIDVSDVKIEEALKPNTLEIGISEQTTPDFMIPEFAIVGDIKTGEKFEMKYQLTCAGYALAYENQTRKNINWGAFKALAQQGDFWFRV